MAAQVITSRDVNALTGRSYPGLEWGPPSLTALLRPALARYEQHRRYRKT